jgi:WD40 repeat protein
MSGRKPQRPRRPRTSTPPEPLEATVEQSATVNAFVDIGGSPLPGLTLRRVLRGHTESVCRLAWSPDGSYLASPAHDSTVRIWDTSNGACVHIVRAHEEAVFSAAWSPDGRRLASSGTKIHIWDAETHETQAVLEDHTKDVMGLSWSPDGRSLASASKDGTVRVWNTDTWASRAFEVAGDQINCVMWRPDGKALAFGSGWVAERNVVGVVSFDIDENDVSTIDHEGNVFGLAWEPSRFLLASSGADGNVYLWDVARRQLVRRLEGHTHWVCNLSFSGDGRFLATKSLDESVRLWRCDTWACVGVLDELSRHSWPSSLAFHPRLPVLATLGGLDKIIRIWELDDALLFGQTQATVHYTTAKLVVVGDSGVGKTGLGWRLAHDEFKEHASTHGQQFWVIPELGLKRKDGTDIAVARTRRSGSASAQRVRGAVDEGQRLPAHLGRATLLRQPSSRSDRARGGAHPGLTRRRRLCRGARRTGPA